MNHLFTRRPCENCEATILRCHQRERITLVVYKLGRGHMPSSAVQNRSNDVGRVADDGLSDYHLLDGDAARRASYLYAKYQQLVIVGNHSCPVNRGETRNSVDCPADGGLPLALT